MKKHKFLRTNQTPEENRLWFLLRAKRFYGYKFRRQMPLGPYIADFVCYRARLIIELDGGQHAERSEYDNQRTSWLNAHGWRVLRFWNNELRMNEEAVLEEILGHLSIAAPLPTPLP
ncbi:endonuclease domain-containing protein [Scandinavium goeteborgense]|uniref:endonuclease domain-containing protein n=1 Tax=Scandinavium goeteborgense TaxID=1851514 RepID=UPI0037F5EDEB